MGGVKSFIRKPITIVMNFIDFLKNLYNLTRNINKKVILSPKSGENPWICEIILPFCTKLQAFYWH